MDPTQWRKAASLASLGTSDDVIYSLFEKLIAEAQPAHEILDFGAGTGNLSRRLLAEARFRSLSAADLMPCPEDLKGKIQWTQCDLNEPLPENWTGRFDWVLGAEVIEHLENPRALFREFKRILRPGGRLLISTPNNESIRSVVSLFFRGHFNSFGDSNYPAHITALLTKDLERIANEAGFKGPRFFFTDSGQIPKLPVRWQSVSGGLLKGRRFSDNVVLFANNPES